MAGWLGGWVAGWLGGWVAGWLGGWVAGWGMVVGGVVWGGVCCCNNESFTTSRNIYCTLHPRAQIHEYGETRDDGRTEGLRFKRKSGES